MSIDAALFDSTGISPDGGGLTLSDFSALENANFAQEWKARYQRLRVQMIPDTARWMRLLRYFHPRRLEDHWQDQFGIPLPKLADMDGLSVSIFNWCRIFIEVYGSLLAGQKPMPFNLDVRALDPKMKSEVFRADAQEKLFKMELENMQVPLHFLDFCTSVQLFGIGYAWTWIDEKSRRLGMQAIPWPGDVLPQWGSNRYGRGGDALESVIITERLPVDTAQRLYPNTKFKNSSPELEIRPDGFTQMLLPSGTTQILKVFWRPEGEQVGYSEIAYDGTESGMPEVLYREDDSAYPDIPLRWSTHFQTPGEPPHKAAGVLDDIIGINTEYNERLSAFSDLLMKFVFPKLKGKGFNINNVPVLGRGDNVIPMTLQQDLSLIQEIVQGGQAYFDSWLGRVENFMLSSVGLSRLMLGAVPPGETSGEALNNLLHSSIARLEVVRTPIQWAWLSLFQEIQVPLLYKFGAYGITDPLTGKNKKVNLKVLFDRFGGFEWRWPDVTPRDALKAIQTAVDLRNAGLMSDETAMDRAQVGSVVDELDKIHENKKDDVTHANDVRLTALARQMTAQEKAVATAPGVGPGTVAPSSPNDPSAVDNAALQIQAQSAPTKGNNDNLPADQGSAQNAAQGARGGVV